MKYQEKFVTFSLKYFKNSSLHPENMRLQLSHNEYISGDQTPDSNNKTRFLKITCRKKLIENELFQQQTH